ncbi:MAG: response regulator [Anaerolineae bacterium]|nr:response regulator [Anaerolineae bacterium]
MITDVVMPQMNGKELADRLQGDRPLLPVLYMSGYPDTEIFGEGGLPADSVFLPKPFNIEDLVQKVQSVLDVGSQGSRPQRISDKKAQG